MPQLRAQIYAYGKGHVGYHLITLATYGDTRALAWILLSLPVNLIRRMWKRARGSSSYPWQLLFVEGLGLLLGPWALWRSHVVVKRIRKAGSPFGFALNPQLSALNSIVPADNASASQIEAAS
jgi:hypothetical protein